MGINNTLGVGYISAPVVAAVAKGRAVKWAAGADAGKLTYCTAITDECVGITVEAQATAGGLVTVQVLGVVEAVAQGAVTAGADVMVSGTGNVGKLLAAAGSTARSIGTAITAATNDLDKFQLWLGTHGLKSPANS